MGELMDPCDAVAYLEATLQEEEEEGFLLALRTVAEVHGIVEIALIAGVGRESLYMTLSEEGNPKLHTHMAMLNSLELRRSVAPENNQQSAEHS